MHYEVYGPFGVDMNTKRPWRERRAEFWESVENKAEGLSKAIGIYVFSTRHGAIRTPWYVGKTVAKTGFRGEVFQDHKLSHMWLPLSGASGASIWSPKLLLPANGFAGRRSVRDERSIFSKLL